MIELKRTNDGGHMELQALRYAAMVSALTFDEVVDAYVEYLTHEGEDPRDARGKLANWLDDVDGEDAVIQRDVRIILASADFEEITTTALWLNDVFSTDIRCVRITPYRVQERLLLNVEQVIPLPEAQEITAVRLRRREAATRTSGTSSADLDPYVVSTPERHGTIAQAQSGARHGPRRPCCRT